METTLHRQLKRYYASDESQTEITVDGFRIDAISPSGELIEVQHASLGALRDKTRRLLSDTSHHLRIVKPIIARKRVVTFNRRGGKVLRSRMSPLRGETLDLFLDLVHFATVFPMDRLTLEVALIEAEEWRIDRKRPTRRGKRFRQVDQQLVAVEQTLELRSSTDLLAQLPISAMPPDFDTAELAAALDRPRWFAQKVAYCLRQTGAARLCGKRGNAQVYRAA